MITVDAELLAPLMADPNSVSRHVDPRDEMLTFALDAAGSARGAFDYFRLGHDLDATVGQIASWSFPGDEVITVLGFACGYGRILRHLVARFSVDRWTASDIDTGALRFVAAEFGVATLRSAAEPEAIDWPQRFDPAEFSYVRPIRGNVDIVEVDGGRVRLLGWARADPPGLEVTVHAGDHQVATVAEFVPSPDVAAVRGAGYEHCRYEIDVDIAGSGDDQLLVVTATSGDQRACFYVQRLADLRRRRLPPWWRRVRALSKR